MQFCTAVNCMDGRVQLPVIRYLQQRFDAEYVDSITEPGPILILSGEERTSQFQSIFERLKISIEEHHSIGVAVVGHHNCAGNPAPKDDQVEQMRKAMGVLSRKYPGIEIIGLWVDENWEVYEINWKVTATRKSA